MSDKKFEEEITLEDIWKNYSFYPKSVQGFNSMNDGVHYTKIDKSEDTQFLNKYSFQTGELLDTIVSSEETGLNISNYTFSDNEEKILFAVETESIYRYSSRSIYYIYTLKSAKLEKLSDEKVRYATLSPNGKKIAYVKGNNLFVKDLQTNYTKQITKDGEYNKIINGATDWVYEEEFGLVQAFFWSPNGKNIAFYRFDESLVKEFSMDMFKNELYPSQNVFKYPKAGEENSEVSIHVYNLQTKKTNKVKFDNEYEYIARVGWTKNDNQLYAFGLNRHQNKHCILSEHI